MKNILVPIGTSKNAVSNLQYAIDLASETGAKVYMISIFRGLSQVGTMTRANRIIKNDTENRLEEVLSQVNKKDVTVIRYSIKGGIIEGIKRFSKVIPVDLMVLSPRSKTIAEGLFLGNISGKLLKETNIPILVVPVGTKFSKPKSMMMAFKNGSFKKDETLSPVRAFIDSFGMSLHVLHVKTPVSTKRMLSETKNIQELQDTYTETENGTTFQGVLEYVQQVKPDMICVVHRKRGFFHKLMERNTIRKEEFHTVRPLLVLKVQE